MYSVIAFLLFLASTPVQNSVQVPQSSLELHPHKQRDNEVSVMENLIQNTARQLEIQKQVHRLMLDFRQQKEAFAEGNQTKAHASQMVRTARQIYECITAHHLHYLFSQEYLEELVFFSSIAGKNRITSP